MFTEEVYDTIVRNDFTKRFLRKYPQSGKRFGDSWGWVSWFWRGYRHVVWAMESAAVSKKPEEDSTGARRGGLGEGLHRSEERRCGLGEYYK